MHQNFPSAFEESSFVQLYVKTSPANLKDLQNNESNTHTIPSVIQVPSQALIQQVQRKIKQLGKNYSLPLKTRSWLILQGYPWLSWRRLPDFLPQIKCLIRQ